MTTRARAAALVLLLTAALLAIPSGTLAQGGTCPGADVLAVDAQTARQATAALVCLVNAYRAENGRPPLKRSGKLARVARRHAEEMERLNYLSHTNRAGENLDRRVRRARYPRKGRTFRSSETLGWAQGITGSAGGVLEVLERSSEHRRRVLRRDFRDVGGALVAGIPVASPAQGATLVLVFGRR